MLIGVPREIYPGEKRVATVPDVVSKLIKLGFDVQIERGAGELADLSDAAFIEAGASIAADAATLWHGSD
ncbi:MAG: transhydrogenase subunit alpha, partial [Pseudomonadota bacterium]